MNFEEFDEKIINEYCKTLLRKDILNINNNKYLKKPYLENYIIYFSSILDEKLLTNNIIKYINNKISSEDILFLINNNINLNTDEKKKIDLFIFNQSNDEIYNQIVIGIINYQIKYFRFYQIVSELLFDNNDVNKDLNNELYNFILIYIKNNKNDIKKHIKINFKFKIFYYYLCKLCDEYYNVYKLFINNNFIKNDDKKDIDKFFLKNIFTNWYNLYKKDIIDNTVSQKTKNFVNKSMLSKILCMPNV